MNPQLDAAYLRRVRTWLDALQDDDVVSGKAVLAALATPLSSPGAAFFRQFPPLPPTAA